jgi:hypothetical protein
MPLAAWPGMRCPGDFGHFCFVRAKFKPLRREL